MCQDGALLLLPGTHSLFCVFSNGCPPFSCFPLQVPFQLAPQPRVDRASWTPEGFPGPGCWESRKGNGRGCGGWAERTRALS